MIESKEITNPFPGLRPFETDEYRLFFGREGQSDALIARLQRSHFLAIVGTSGSGKSSLVRAGLLPALRGGLMAGAGSGWRIAIMRPGSDPIGNLAIALAHKDVLLEAGGGLPPAEAEAAIEATLRRGSLGLTEVTRQARLTEHDKLLVVVDQFEELFRFRAARPSSSTGDDASAFVKLLLEASQQHELSIYVVPTMRSDFLGDCAQFQGLPEAINDGQYLIPRMARDERRSAITGPIGVTRGKITEPLVNRLMNDVGDNPDQLPILQHALMRTWDYWATDHRNGEPIGLEHYEAVGTMSHALSRHADEAWTELDERGQSIAEIMFKALTERGADNREIRRPTCLKDICEIANASPLEVSAVIEVFRGGGRSFLMPPAGVALGPETVIDISHESLIRNWDRLKEWVNEEAQSARIYRRLSEAAVLHREGSEGLLQDPGLQIALDWRDQNQPTVAWAERYHPEFEESVAYLEQSSIARDAAVAERERQRQEELQRERREREQAEVYAEQQRKSAQRLRRFTFALVLISLFALAAAGASVYAFAKAKFNEAHAQNLADELKKSLEGETAAKEGANRHRADAEAAQKKAEDEQKKAEEERKRADAAARLAAQHAEDERRAKEGLRSALAKSEAIKDASRFFRSAIGDWDRASNDEARGAAYEKFQQSTKRFERTGDYDGLAAAYLKLGYAPDLNPTNADERKMKYYPKAIEYYRKSSNHAEAGETLESLGSLYGQLASSDDPTNPEMAKKRAEADRLYSEAYKEFGLSKPPNLAGMVAALERTFELYKDGDVQSKRRAIEVREQSLNLQAAHPLPETKYARKELADLYLATEPTERAEALIHKLAEGARAQGGPKGEAEFLKLFTYNEGPLWQKYFEEARRIYRQEADADGEASLLHSTASDIRDAELRKVDNHQALSNENCWKAVDYCEEALKFYEKEGAPGAQRTAQYIWGTMGDLRKLVGQRQEAIEAYSRAIALGDDKPDPNSYFEALYEKLGDTQAEANQLTQALETYTHLLKHYRWNSVSDAPAKVQKKINSIQEKLKQPQQAPSAPQKPQAQSTPPR